MNYKILFQKIKLLLGITTLGSFFMPCVVYAETVTLAQAIEKAQRLSPDIRSLENQVDATDARARLALAPTEPSLSINYNDMTQALNPAVTSSTVYQLTQPLAFPGKAFLSRSVAHEQADNLRAQLRSTQLQVSTNVKTAYYQLGLAQENIRINREQREFYERIIAIAQRRYESGSITQVDFLNAKLSLYSSMNDLADLQANLRTARSQLNVMLYNPIDTDISVEPFKVLSTPAIKAEEAQAKMLEKRPEILAATHLATAADRSKKLAWMSILPDFQLSVGTTFYNVPEASPLISTPGGQIHTFAAGLQLTFPIWALFNEREGIVAASKDSATAEANLNSVFNQSKIALETSLASLDATRIKIENYDKNLVPVSKQSLNLALVSYGSGKIDYIMLASTVMTWRNTLRDYYAMLVSYLIGYATFGQLIGEDL